MKKTLKAFLDRIEGDIAVIYFGKEEYKIDIPIKFLPKGITESSNLKIDISVDSEKNKAVSNELDEIRKKLLENN